MKSYLGRVLVCLVPVVLGIAVCAWASYYGKFRLGVDLAGGTILVYEVDKSKGEQDAKPEDLAAALKRRIDPADLLNVTIRPVAGETPRVEIILPTGGQGEQAAEQQAWHKLLEEVAAARGRQERLHRRAVRLQTGVDRPRQQAPSQGNQGNLLFRRK